MKNLLFMGLLCLFCSALCFSQTTEPTPLRFNWGAYTAPFHDSSHKITKPVLGWQWGFNDSSFDVYIGVNTGHGGSNDGNSYKRNRIGMRTILEYHSHTHDGHRYDAEITTRLNNDFRPYKYDSSGAIFGWKWRNTAISQLDTATPQKPHGGIKVNGSGLVLKNMSPNRGFIRPKENTMPTTGQEWYLAMNMRRTDSNNIDTTNNPALSVKIKYWARNLSDNTKFPMNDKSIIFEKLPQQAQWHSRGYWNDSFTVNTTRDSILITRKMLPLHGISGRSPDVTYFAYFRLTDWNIIDTNKLNPMLSNATDLFTTGKDYIDQAEGNYHIDSMSVEVTGFGYPVSIDYVRLEEPDHRRLMLGEFDTTIKNSIQDFITDLRTKAPHVHLQGISPAIEYRWWSIPSYRYLNTLVNGYAFADAAEIIHHHISHAIQSTKGYWQFGRYHAIDNNIAAPWFRRIKKDSCEVGRQYSFGYGLGYLVNPGDTVGNWGNFGDTTKSFYETAVHRCTYHSQHEYMTRPALQSLDTMSLTNFIENVSMKWFSNPATLQIALDKKQALNEFYYGTSNEVLYGEQPWWSQFLIHTRFHVIPATCSLPAYRAVYEDFKRMYTGEELRYMLWADIIRGAKGLMIDNGGIVRMIPGKTGSFTLRKVQELGVYDPDNPNDSDFILHNDSTYLSKYMNRGQIGRVCGIDSNRIYLGTKSARLNVKAAFDFMNHNADEIMRMRLVSWMTKGYKTFYSGDTSAMGSLLRYKMNVNQTGFRLRPLGRTLSGNPYYEPKDSTFYDLTILRDKNDTAKEFDSVFYVGVVNRRTDPLRMVRTPISDTTKPKLLKFLSFAEYKDSCAFSPDSLLWKNEYWTQHGAREITIPFKVRGRDAGDYPLLRIQEIGGTLDTVIGCDKPLALNYLPGEGKIFRVRVQYPDRFTGDLAHSNQTKLVAHNIMRHDSVQNMWVEGDSVVYHSVYHKEIPGTTRRTGVYYRVSKPIADY